MLILLVQVVKQLLHGAGDELLSTDLHLIEDRANLGREALLDHDLHAANSRGHGLLGIGDHLSEAGQTAAVMSPQLEVFFSDLSAASCDSSGREGRYEGHDDQTLHHESTPRYSGTGRRIIRSHP